MNKLLNTYGYIFIETISHHLNMYSNINYIYLFHDTTNNLTCFITALDNQEAIDFFNKNSDNIVWFKNCELLLDIIS